MVYLKAYPRQVVLGQLFGLTIAQANYGLHHLLPVLRRALDDLGVLPERGGAFQLCRHMALARGL